MLFRSNPIAYPKLPYDPVKDFVGVVRLGDIESLIVAHPSVPANNFDELVALAKAKPDALTWSTIGVGSGAHMTLEWLRTRGVQFLHVPFKGGEAAMNAVIGGQVNLSLNAAGRTVPMVKSGKLKAIAVSGTRASQFIPGVRAMGDSGYGVDTGVWIGLFAPAATPKSIQDKLFAAVHKVMQMPDVQERLKNGMMTLALSNSPQEWTDSVRQQTLQWSEVVKANQVKID